MELAVQKIAMISFLVLGLSHIAQPRAWARYFIRLRELGNLGNFLNAWMTLAAGSLIVGFHNVWTGLPVTLTVLGWLFVIKATLYFLFPSIGLKSLSHISEERAKMFIVPGVMLVAVAGLLAYHVFASA